MWASSVPPLSVITRVLDPVLSALTARCGRFVYVDSLGDLPGVLADRAAGPCSGPRTLDLVGHSTVPAHLLHLGDTVINMVDPAIEQRFRELARDGLLARAGVVAIRLIGCQTAVASAAQRTMRWLADAVGLPVFGTTKLLVSGHFCATGFDPAFEHILAVARPVQNRALAS
jgi:hypothetical protein